MAQMVKLLLPSELKALSSNLNSANKQIINKQKQQAFAFLHPFLLFQIHVFRFQK
jgi:hypothetical protein